MINRLSGPFLSDILSRFGLDKLEALETLFLPILDGSLLNAAHASSIMLENLL